MSYLCISIRWLDDRYHGKDIEGRPEWPPSPLRLFQALLATAYRHRSEADSFLASFRWLQSAELPPPVIIAPRAQPGQPFTRFVPNNDSDVKPDRQNRLAAKAVRPTLLLDELPIHYLWELSKPLTDVTQRYVAELCEIARSVVTFGWGVDMAIATGSIVGTSEINLLRGEAWISHESAGGARRRVPCSATLDALLNRYKLFSGRLTRPEGTGGGIEYLCDLPPLEESAFHVVSYRRVIDPPARTLAAFSLLKPDASGFRPFDTARRSYTVAGMLRCAAKRAAKSSGWSEEQIGACVLGHGEPKGAEHITVGPRRFAYLPLPSIEFRGEGKPRVVGSVRRAIVTAFADGCENEIAWASRALSGQTLINESPEHRVVALLASLPPDDKALRCYTQGSAAWATVTPVVLPGFDDPRHYRRRLKEGTDAGEQRTILERLAERIDGLFRKAIVQAGFSEVLASNAEIEWRKTGFWPGVDLADRYGIPDYLKKFPRYHAKISWRDAKGRPLEISGPICIGGGRFYGLGLFAATGY